MLNSCVKNVDWLGISYGKWVNVFTDSTALVKYLTSQAFFVRNLYTTDSQFFSGFKHPIFAGFNLLISILATLSPPSNKEANKLI